LGRELLLPAALLGLHALDLVLHRREQLLPLGELGLDRRLLGGAVGDDPGLLRAGVLQVRAMRLDLVPVGLDLREDPGVLARHAVHGVDPGDDVVEAARAQQHVERRVAIAVDVEVAEALGDPALRDVQALARGDEVAGVDLELTVDAVELYGRAVVRLDGHAQVRVEVLELDHDGLRLGLLVLDVRVCGRYSGSKQ
jgi:hypothetical protein